MKANAKEAEYWVFLGAHRLTTQAGPPDVIRDLLSKIERKLSVGADARQDMQSLRDLLNAQLLTAKTLQATQYPSSYLSRDTQVSSLILSPSFPLPAPCSLLTPDL